MSPTPKSPPATPSRRCTIPPLPAAAAFFSESCRYAAKGQKSKENPLHQSKNQQRIPGGEDVVEHDAEAALQAQLELPDRRRLHHIEDAEKEERRRLPARIVGREREHEQERDDLVPAHRAVIRDAKVAARALAGPDADGEEPGEDAKEHERLVAASHQPPDRKRDQPAGRAPRDS